MAANVFRATEGLLYPAVNAWKIGQTTDYADWTVLNLPLIEGAGAFFLHAYASVGRILLRDPALTMIEYVSEGSGVSFIAPRRIAVKTDPGSTWNITIMGYFRTQGNAQ